MGGGERQVSGSSAHGEKVRAHPGGATQKAKQKVGDCEVIPPPPTPTPTAPPHCPHPRLALTTFSHLFVAERERLEVVENETDGLRLALAPRLALCTVGRVGHEATAAGTGCAA
jgi:hypothetical protein